MAGSLSGRVAHRAALAHARHDTRALCTVCMLQASHLVLPPVKVALDGTHLQASKVMVLQR